MEPNATLGMGDPSWKLPTSSHILMRASQISSDFERGNQSYQRLSLGEFFEQRSEALGWLGNEEEAVKRVCMCTLTRLLNHFSCVFIYFLFCVKIKPPMMPECPVIHSVSPWSH